jgi:hypothetical protein
MPKGFKNEFKDAFADYFNPKPIPAEEESDLEEEATEKKPDTAEKKSSGLFLNMFDK